MKTDLTMGDDQLARFIDLLSDNARRHELTMKDVCYFDEEGYQYDYISNVFVERVGVYCQCGYSYVADVVDLCDELEDLYQGKKWEQKFADLANRRYREVEQ